MPKEAAPSNEVDKGHLAAWEQPRLFTAELWAALGPCVSDLRRPSRRECRYPGALRSHGLRREPPMSSNSLPLRPPMTRDAAGTLLGQTMGLVAVTAGLFAVGAYLGRNLAYQWGWLLFIAGRRDPRTP